MILATHGIIGSSGGSLPLLLDTYSGATAAYSLRKLRSAYTGYAIRVRRSSDNTSQDIGFDGSGNLDTTSLLSFVGSGSGYISIWYDQTTSGNNLSQVTLAKQPSILISGALITQSGKPALFFNSSLLQASRVFSNSNFSIFNTLTGSSGQYNVVWMNQHAGATDLNRTVFIQPSDVASPYNKLKTFFNNGTSYSIISNNAVFDNTMKLINVTSDGSGNTNQYVNSTAEGSLTGQTWSPLNTNLNLGALGNSFSYFTGYTSELICYTTNQSANRTGIESNINTYYNVY